MHDRARCWPSSGLRDVALQHVWGLRVVLLSLCGTHRTQATVLFAGGTSVGLLKLARIMTRCLFLKRAFCRYKTKRNLGHTRPPRSRPQLVDGARGARNCVPKEIKWREEPLRPPAQMR